MMIFHNYKQMLKISQLQMHADFLHTHIKVQSSVNLDRLGLVYLGQSTSKSILFGGVPGKKSPCTSNNTVTQFKMKRSN